MKTFTPCVTGVLAAVSLALTSVSSQAQGYLTNLTIYNFDTNQVSGIWTASGPDAVSVQWDPTTDASNNPASGSMLLTVNCNGGQYLLWDGLSPRYSPLPLQGFVVFTNLSWDMRYDARSAIRTNTTAAGVNGSQGPGSLDFGYMRVGTTDDSYGQDWYYYWAIPATNGLGQPNTNWIHMSVDLSSLTVPLPTTSSIFDTMFSQYDAAFGNELLKGNQYIWFDNIQYSGRIGALPPHMSIQETTPALRFFGGAATYGRSQIALADNNESWIGGPFPITYSMTLLDNATNFPTPVDTHIQIIQGNDNYSGADYTDPNTLWLQILSTSSNACIAQIQWKTNHPDANPGQDPNTTMLQITNPVRAGTWMLTFLSDTNGTLTAPGAAPAPFTLGILSDADATTDFGQPVQVRFGLQNNGNPANAGIPDDWAGITVAGTAGLNGTNYTENFSEEGTNQLNTGFWNLATSDGTDDQVLVPTNAPYWIIWNTPDTGYILETATNLTGPWRLPEYYADGTNQLPTELLQQNEQWNLMLPQYLPTANGVPGGPLSPTAFFRLSTTEPPLH